MRRHVASASRQAHHRHFLHTRGQKKKWYNKPTVLLLLKVWSTGAARPHLSPLDEKARDRRKKRHGARKYFKVNRLIIRLPFHSFFFITLYTSLQEKQILHRVCMERGRKWAYGRETIPLHPGASRNIQLCRCEWCCRYSFSVHSFG